ncbi:MAG: hypothetical protein L3J05_05075 [Robiginitomaculum sp.]|nr:hypothetical protein [Robiginitomaculum sp.]
MSIRAKGSKGGMMVFDPFISMFIRAGFALLFVLTAVHKLRDMGAFKTVMSGYKIAPQKLVPLLGFSLPTIELSIAVLLIAYPLPGILGAGALLGLYALLMAFNIARGHVHIDCGCFWGSANAEFSSLTWGQVMRNVVLVAILLLALIPTNTRALGAMDGVNLVLGLGFAYVAIKAGSTLIAVRRRMREFGHA